MPLDTAQRDGGLIDARELNLFVTAAREDDVNMPGGSHDLLRYWTRGEGAVKIRWGTDGSFDRCVRHLGKYVKNPQGLCAEYHKAATGEWPAEEGIPSAGEVYELSDGLVELYDGVIELAGRTQSFTADPDEPYGDVRYADPGYRGDGRKRYPIDTPEHIRAAWSYINMPKNAAKYSADDLAKVKARIRKAMEGLGAEVADEDEREEAALTATQEFHGTHDQSDHGNWADQLKGMKDVTSTDIQNTIKSLGSGGKPSSTRKINPKYHNDEGYTSDPNVIERDSAAEEAYERAISQRTSNDYDEDDSDTTGFIGSDREFALTAAAKGKRCKSGQHKMPDGTCMDDNEMKNQDEMPMPPMDSMTEYADETWEGVLVVEGAESGDGRLFALGSLDWASLPMPLQFQPANNGGHTGSVTVGEITHAARRGNQVYGWGKVFGTALNGEHGDGVRTAMKVGGVSVDVDKVKDADVELVYAGDESGEGGGNPFAKPETTIFHRGRIRGATLVAFPAFVEAKLKFTGALGVREAAKVESCGCGPDAEPAEDDETELVVAAASPSGESTNHTITIPNVPPAHWFAEPTDVEVSGALTITDEGRVFGIVAPAGVTHRNVKTQVPRGLDFSRFHKGETIVRGGGRVVTGVITADCGHAPTENYGTYAKRREHYDNSCSVLANVRVGYSRNGNIWAAGALNPGATAEQVSKAFGCALSLDAQPNPDRPGQREFIAAHAVPVPGFPLARPKASATYSDGVLSAAALPIEYVSRPRPAHVDAGVALEFVNRAKAAAARDLGLDPVSRKRELALQLSLIEFHGTHNQQDHDPTRGKTSVGPSGEVRKVSGGAVPSLKPGKTVQERMAWGRRVADDYAAARADGVADREAVKTLAKREGVMVGDIVTAIRLAKDKRLSTL